VRIIAVLIARTLRARRERKSGVAAAMPIAVDELSGAGTFSIFQVFNLSRLVFVLKLIKLVVEPTVLQELLV
jgi:hypothetical protein